MHACRYFILSHPKFRIETAEPVGIVNRNTYRYMRIGSLIFLRNKGIDNGFMENRFDIYEKGGHYAYTERLE